MIKEIFDNQIASFLNIAAPDQVKFITGHYFKHGKNVSFGWHENNKIVGCIRYCIQEIGYEQKTPTLFQNSEILTEAKINAFAVSENYRNKGIGRKLQLKVIEDATQRKCSQVASYSTFDKVENYAVKIKLGFCILPEIQKNGAKGCFFLMNLSNKKQNNA